MKGLNRFDCECGATIYFTKINHVVKEWAKYHKKHMKKYLKAGSYNKAVELLEKESKNA